MVWLVKEKEESSGGENILVCCGAPGLRFGYFRIFLLYASRVSLGSPFR